MILPFVFVFMQTLVEEVFCKCLGWKSSKHLKGQLDPPVSDGNVFCIKAGQLDPPVVSWTPL